MYILDEDSLACTLSDAWRDLLESKEIEVCQWKSDRGYEEDIDSNKYKHETLYSHGVEGEGAIPKKYNTMIGAIGAYIETLNSFVRGRNGILVWRVWPEIKTDGRILPKDFNCPPTYYVYSRLVFIPEGTEIIRTAIVSAK